MSGDSPRRSLLSLFGSPNKPKTGVAQVARSGLSSQVRPPRNLVHPFTGSMNLLLSSQGQVSVDEFADTDLNHSGHSAEEARDAETIYSIISGYEDERNLNFLFMEDFSGHSHENSPDSPPRPRQPAQKTDDTPTISPDSTTASYATPRGSTAGSHSLVHSQTSTELLGRIRSVEIHESSGSNSGLSGRGRFSASSRSLSNSRGIRSSFGHRSRDSRGLSSTNLTAGIDSSLGLPVTLYTVQDAEHEQNRWSLFAQTAAPLLEVPQAPGQNSSGSNSALGSLQSSRAYVPPRKAAPAHYGPFSGTGSENPHQSLPTISTRVLAQEGSEHSGFSITDHGEGVHFSPPILPQESKLSDIESRRSGHNNMYSNDSSEIHGQYDIEKGYPYFQQEEGLTAESWTKWALLMVMGLVAVPIYFLLAFGCFDFGGYSTRLRKIPLGPVNRHYFSCYTYWQKLWSFVIGVVWLMLVFAAIAIGFGLRARFHL